MKKADLYAKVLEDIAVVHKKAVDNAHAVRDKVYAVDELSELDKAVKQITMARIKNELIGNDVSAIEKQERDLTERFEQALARHGFKKSDFIVRYTCKKCSDTGRLPDGEYCTCFQKRLQSEIRKANADSPLLSFRFSDHNPSVVSDDALREKLNDLYLTMQTYVQKYPSVTKHNIVLFGGTGVGKSCLASALANAFIDRGVWTLYHSSFEIARLFLQYHNAPTYEKEEVLEDVLNADVLVIDDLAAEPTYNNVTEPYLLMLLSERARTNKVTVVTCNLDADKFLLQYGERVFSRLLDKRNSYVKNLVGVDIRRK